MADQPEEQQERHYNIQRLNFLFAASSVVLLLGIGWMFYADYDRPWKKYQEEFRALEIEKTRIKYDLEVNKLNKQPEYKELAEKIVRAQEDYHKRCPNLSDTKQKETVAATIKRVRAESELLNQSYRLKKAQLDASKFEYEEALSHKDEKLPAAEKHFDQLNKEVTALKLTIEKLTAQLEEKVNLENECRAELKELEKQERVLASQTQILERKLKKIDPAQMSFTNQLAGLIRNLPIIDFANPSQKIEQVVLKDLSDDVHFMQVPKVDRCVSCHLGIANPDYKNAPQPFTTHPNLELYVGNNSPHALEEFGCTTCHGGRGRGTDFINSVHTPSSIEQKEAWEKKYQWHEYHHWETPMYPLPYVEAGCFKCHSGEIVIKGAEKLNLGLNLIEKAGCYACHAIEKYKDWPKPGPDLTHLASKTNKKWTALWIADPQSFRHSWMPAFFGLSNNSDAASIKRSQQEIQAIVHYLFAQSSDFNLENMPSWGDAQKGEEVVASIGCLGCHQVKSEKSVRPYSRQSLRLEHGPKLSSLGTKTSKVWLYNWLKDPDRYHPETKMPNFRLTDEEAADAAAFLAADKDAAFLEKQIADIDLNIINKIAEEFLMKSLTRHQIEAKLNEMTVDEKLRFTGGKLIGHYGCYSCHTIKGFEHVKPIGTDLNEEGSKAVDKLDFGFIPIEHANHPWFTQKLKDPRIFDKDKVKTPDEKLRMPQFDFADQEVEAIVTALLGFVKEKPGPSKLPRITPEKQYIQEGQKIVRQFNCQGCHIIQGEGGGIQPAVRDWLIKYGNREENEAQALIASFSPPNLIGEGKKVHAQWLFDFLHEPTPIRPWLKARMPTYKFNVTHLNALVKYFNAVDGEEFPFSNIVSKEQLTPEQLAAGEKLFSNEYFGCAQCHIVGDKMPAGSMESWSPDFALAETRLKPEWIIDWIKDPQSLQPGTKMPTFFDPANFESSGPEDILGGDELKQIKALRDYILTLSAPVPKEPALSNSPQPPVVPQQPQAQ